MPEIKKKFRMVDRWWWLGSEIL